MADDAFALSPMAARSTQPTEADYEAIRDAFLETARGRWFLGEYAKRNRNADTTVVLEAVARLEQTLAKQRQQLSSDQRHVIAAVLADVMNIFAELRVQIEATVHPDFFQEVTKPLRGSARIIQEIAWGLRESGSDTRICNLLDGQGAAINAACEHISLVDLHDKIVQLFDESSALLEEIAGHDAAAEAAGTPSHSATAPSLAPLDVTPRGGADSAHDIEFETVEIKIVAPETVESGPVESVTVEFKAVEPETVEIKTVGPETVKTEIASAEPIVAARSTDNAPAAGIITAEVVTPRPPQVSVTPRGPMIRFQESEAVAPLQKPDEIVQLPKPEEIVQHVAVVEPEAESKFEAAIAKTVSAATGSLGASILANGIVAVSPARPDPMAPFKRMSQAEKIAFFS